MNTGENEQSLRAVIDLLRKASVVILGFHFYVTCYAVFHTWGLTHPILQKVILNIASNGLFKTTFGIKLVIVGLLGLSLIGAKGKKDEAIRKKQILTNLASGCLFYFSSKLCFYFPISDSHVAILYMAITSTGFLLMMDAGAKLSRLIKVSLKKDVFNEGNEEFPQEERLLENEYSINLPGKYKFGGKMRNMWLNIINGARMCMILGSPGAGKTFYLVREVIKQTLEIRQFPGMLLYDFKYDDLAKIAYNSWLKSKHKFKVVPGFFIINFDNPINRCNPLEPSLMKDITDATESSRTILLGLNMEWIKKSGGDRTIYD